MPTALTLGELLTRLEAPNPPMVVLPTADAAAALRRAFDQRQQDKGLGTWEPAHVLSWPQWLTTLWTEAVLAGHEDRLLLNAAQELSVWRSIIRSAPESTPLTPDASLASMAQDAFRLAAAYRATGELRAASAQSHDARIFAQWAEAFRIQCGQNRWLSASLSEAALADHVRQGHLKLPSTVELCGFNDLTPSRQSLFDALQAAGCRIESLHLTAPQSERFVTELEDEAAEATAAARWLRSAMQANPDGRFALIVPELSAEWPQLEPVLRDTLAPWLNDIAADLSVAPWSTTASVPLGSLPMVASLLDLAQWLRSPLAVGDITGVLLSPALAGAGTLDERARFDAHVLGKQLLLRPELDLRRVLALAREKDCSALADWLAPLVELGDRIATLPPRRTFADWTAFLRDVARTTGWPSPESLEQPSTEAAADAFDAVLDLVATLDFSGQKATFAEALQAIRHQAASTPAPAAPNARLSVLSLPAALGQAFDAAVFLRSTDSSLPPPARRDPLLDWSLQRSFAMPGTDAARDMAQGQRLVQAVVEACEQTLFTSSKNDTYGETLPSHLPLGLSANKLINEYLIENNIPRVPLTETAADILPLSPLPSPHVPGGARVLQLQAACGFLAFAEIRLGGRRLEAQEPGFDAAESGNVLHSVLEFFWSEVKTHKKLLSMTDAKCAEAIRWAVDRGTSRNLRLNDSWDRAYVEMLKERMRSILTSWLPFERNRTPFTVVGRENKQEIEIGPLRLSVRIDRIDHLDEGGLVLIDYKTGSSAKPSAWESDRPDQPQLPLYALLPETGELRGLAFARIRAGEEMQWAGYASDPGILPKKGSALVDFPTVTEQWQQTLSALAKDFHSGVNSVSPKDYNTNCKRCPQRLLCRLDVETLMAGSADDEDSVEGSDA